jgi:hypothetical protein
MRICTCDLFKSSNSFLVRSCYWTLPTLIWRQLDLNSSHIFVFFLYRKKEATHKDKNNGQWNLQQQKKKSWKYFTTKRYINEITIYISRCWCSIAICSIRTLSSTGCWWWNSWRCWYSRCWLLITIIRWKLKNKTNSFIRKYEI